jgi:hypothetical protein
MKISDVLISLLIKFKVECIKGKIQKKRGRRRSRKTGKKHGNSNM